MPEGTLPGFISLVPLLAIRIGAALRLAPFLGGRPLPLLPWAGISIALAAVVAPQAYPVVSAPFGSALWLALAVKELFVGVVIGALARIAFAVLDVAGDLARLSTVSIPAAGQGDGTRGAPLTRGYVLLGTAAFLLVDGHHAFIAGLIGTVRCMPPGSLPGTLESATTYVPLALKLFSSAMSTAVLISAPVFAAGIAADVVIGLLSRLSPGMAPPVGAQATRAIFVQLAIVASLGIVVTAAVNFLKSGIEQLSLCQPSL